MEKERRIKILTLVTLIVAVLGLSVAFAAMSRTLTINGTANVNASDWDIYFNNLSVPIITGGATVKTAPTLTSTSISGFEVSLTKPGDSVTYSFDIVNNGSIDAEVSDIKMSDYSIIDEENIDLKSILKEMFTECDWNGDGVTTDEERETAMNYVWVELPTFENLLADTKETVSFKIYYSADATELPKGDVTLNINMEVLYVQG